MSLTNKISSKIASELGYDEEKSAVIAYGLFAVMQILISLVLVAVIGAIFAVAWQALTASFVASILRQYSGGIHASKPSTCIIIGTLVTISIAILTHYVFLKIEIIYLLGFIFVLTFFSFFTIAKKAPVDSKAKPITNTYKRNKMKKYSIIVLSFYFVFILVLVLLYYFNKKALFIEYSILICLAFSWQSFTLTKAGHILLNKSDSILNKLLNKQRRIHK